jgi:hypothetical protein
MSRTTGRSIAGAAAAAGVSVFLAACAGSPPNGFSVANARAHVHMLGRTIGIRPVGTQANRRAREYIVSELARSGFSVRVQEADATRASSGLTTHVFNIIAVKAGARPDAVALVSHYDSTGSGPGAADAGLGVAVCLEAGRVLAARASPQHSLVVALTDAEEVGLMGALALADDPAWASVRAFLNFEAVGTSGPSALFEAGPGNTWLVKAWARHVLAPYGGSVATEVYRYLPNSTDFAILGRTGLPGLNFAPIGNSYAYHTHLDTPERLPDETIAQTGRSAVAIADALDHEDLARRTPAWPLFFDIGGIAAVAGEASVAGWLAGLAIILGIAAWVRLVMASRAIAGIVPLLLSAIWAVAGGVAVVLLMTGAIWGLRAATGVNHPWYAHPDRCFAALAASGVFGGWLVSRLAARVPPRFKACGHPACAWCLILFLWIILAAVSIVFAPGASYLVTIPLLGAGLALVAVNGRREGVVRIASIVPAVVAGLICLRPAWMLLHFMVPNLGRQSIVTPIFVFPVLLFAFAVILVLPVLPIITGWKPPLVRPSIVTGAVLVALTAALGLALVAPAYDAEHPQYRQAQYVQDVTRGTAWWEVGANEEGLAPAGAGVAPSGWTLATGLLPLSMRIDSLGGPFVYRAQAEAGLAPPAGVTASIEPQGERIAVEVRVQPQEVGATVILSLPENVTPIESSPLGAIRNGLWRARFIAPPPQGVVFRLTVRAEDQSALADARVAVITRGLPGGEGPLRLPGWLPQDAAAWYARTVSLLPLQ